MKKWFLKLRKWWLLNKLRRLNPNPREYRMWEHTMWGDAICVREVDEKAGIFYIYGWLPRRPENGDKLIYKTGNDKNVVGYIAVGYITDIEYCRDPRDMFFATVIPCDYEKDAK